jgi:hypothetical protein
MAGKPLYLKMARYNPKTTKVGSAIPSAAQMAPNGGPFKVANSPNRK